MTSSTDSKTVACIMNSSRPGFRLVSCLIMHLRGRVLVRLRGGSHEHADVPLQLDVQRAAVIVS